MDNIIFTFSCGGRTLTMDGSDWCIVDYTGLESTDYDYSTSERIDGIGAQVRKRKRLPRKISIEADFQDYSARHSMRQEVISFFRPDVPGILTVNNCGTSRMIEYNVEKLTIGSTNLYAPLSILIELNCPDPDFQSADLFTANLATWVNGWYWSTSGWSFGENGIQFRTRGDSQATIINDGDLDAPLEIEFWGPSNYVSITNVTTGEEIRLDYVLANGSKMRITTDFGKKSAVVIDSDGSITANAYNYLTEGSSFFWLKPGENILTYEGTEGASPNGVAVRYRERYFGV